MYAQKFTGGGNSVVDQKDYLARILETEYDGVAQEDERYFENDANGDGAGKLFQTYSSFKTNTQNGIEEQSLGLMLEDLEKQHGFVKENASIIYKEAQIVFYRHAENHPELESLTEVVFLFLHDLLHQVRKEEVFFAETRKIEKTKRYLLLPGYTGLEDLKNTIKLLENDLDKSLNYLKLIRRLTLNYITPTDACLTHSSLFEKLKRLEEELILHYHLEKKFLFPMAIELAEKKQSKIKVWKFLGL